MDKKCNKFLKALAKNLVEGEDHLRNKSLKKVFTKAVKRLPESILKNAIQENFAEAFLNLKIRIKKLKDKVERTLEAVKLETLDKEDNGAKEEEEENVEEERLPIDNSAHDFPFNFYSKNKTAELESSEKLNTASVNQYFLKKIQLCSKQQNVVKLVKEFQRVTEETTIISTLDHLLVLTSGIKDPSLIKKLLFVFLRKMQPLVEKYLEEENFNKVAIVQETLHQFLCISQMRYNSSKTSMKDDKPLYKDLIASLVSMYLDLSFFLFRNEMNKIKLSRLLYSFVNLMLKDFPEQKYDVLLQLTQIHTDQMELLYPLLQFCVERRTGVTDAPSYIKYMISVAIASNNSQQTQLTFQDAIKRARTVIPPGDIELWLEDHELSDIIDDCEDINNLTLFLLDNMTDDLQTKLIDGLCDDESVDIKEEEKEEDAEDNLVVFNPLLNDSSFFTSSSMAEVEKEEFEDIFLVDKKGSHKDYAKEKTPSQDQSLVDEPEIEDTRKSAKKNKADTKNTSSLIKSGHKMVAVVSPNKKMKPVSLEEEFVKSTSYETITDEKSGMNMEQYSPKLRSTAKYLRTTPKSPSKETEKTDSGLPIKSSEKLISPDSLIKKSSSSESSSSPKLQKDKTPKVTKAATSEVEQLTISSTVSSEIKSLKIKSPPPSKESKTPKSNKITSPAASAIKTKIFTESTTSSDVQTLKIKSPASSDADDKPAIEKLQTLSDMKTSRSKNTTLSNIKIPKELSTKQLANEQTQAKSPTSSDVQHKGKSPSTSDVKTPKTKSTASNVKTPKLKSPKPSEIDTPKHQSVVKNKIKSPIPSDIESPKITSPTQLDVKTPKIKSSTPADVGGHKAKVTPSGAKTLKIKSPTDLDVKTPEIKSPTQSVKSPTSSDSDLKKGKIKSPKASDVDKPRIKSPTPSPKHKSPTSSTIIESSTDTKSPKLKSPKKQSSENIDKETFKSPKASLAIKSPASSTKKSIDSSDIEIISLSSEASSEVNGKSARRGSRVRRPSNKFLLSQATAMSTGDDTGSDRSVICLTPKVAKTTAKANTREGMIKQYTIISDSENTDMEQTTVSKCKRGSDVPIPDLTVHLNKSRKVSSTESDSSFTPSKLKLQKRRSTAGSEKNSGLSPQLEKDENSVSASDKSPKNAKLTGKEMHSVLEKVSSKLQVVKEDEVMVLTTTKTKLTSDINKVRSPINLRRRSTSESGVADNRPASKRRNGAISDDEISSKVKAQPTPSKTSKTQETTDEKEEAATFSDPCPMAKDNMVSGKSSSPSKTKSSPKQSQSDGDVGTKKKSAQKTPLKRYSLRSR